MWPNGLAFSPDFSKLYLAVSNPENPAWYVYDVNEDGDLLNRRLFVDARPMREVTLKFTKGRGVEGVSIFILFRSDCTIGTREIWTAGERGGFRILRWRVCRARPSTAKLLSCILCVSRFVACYCRPHHETTELTHCLPLNRSRPAATSGTSGGITGWD